MEEQTCWAAHCEEVALAVMRIVVWLAACQARGARTSRTGSNGRMLPAKHGISFDLQKEQKLQLSAVCLHTKGLPNAARTASCQFGRARRTGSINHVKSAATPQRRKA